MACFSSTFLSHWYLTVPSNYDGLLLPKEKQPPARDIHSPTGNSSCSKWGQVTPAIPPSDGANGLHTARHVAQGLKEKYTTGTNAHNQQLGTPCPGWPPRNRREYTTQRAAHQLNQQLHVWAGSRRFTEVPLEHKRKRPSAVSPPGSMA